MTLDAQVNLAESDKVLFYYQKEWLKEYKNGNGIFYGECNDDKNCASSEDSDSDWEESSSGEDKSSDSNMKELSTVYSCCIVFFSVFSSFSLIFYCFFQAMRKGFSRVSMIQISKIKTRVKEATNQRRSETDTFSENHRNSVNVFFQ